MSGSSSVNQAAPEADRAPDHEPQYACFAATVSEQRAVDLLDPDLLDSLSADLREPLAIIKGYAETLLLHGDRFSRDERHEFLTAIIDASESFERILQRCLPSNL